MSVIMVSYYLKKKNEIFFLEYDEIIEQLKSLQI